MEALPQWQYVVLNFSTEVEPILELEGLYRQNGNEFEVRPLRIPPDSKWTEWTTMRAVNYLGYQGWEAVSLIEPCRILLKRRYR